MISPPGGFQTGYSQGSSSVFPLDNHVAKGTPNLMKMSLCFGGTTCHLLFGGAGGVLEVCLGL